MRPDIRDFLDIYRHKGILLSLEFGVIHNIITTMNAIMSDPDIQEDALETLTYCQYCLVSQIIVQFPQCASIYCKDHPQTTENPDENQNSDL
jgi:hypothetical protein